MVINKKTLLFSIVTVLLLVVLVFSVVGNCVLLYKARSVTEQISVYKHNDKVLNFTKMFVTLVLKSDGDVSFEDRLTLENAVRAIGDKEIFSQWQKFTKSTDQEAGKEAKNLFGLLLAKINQ